MQRRLVICNEAAGHPLRRILPPPVIDRELHVVPKKKERWWRKEDTHLFGISFCAFFVVFTTFIA